MQIVQATTNTDATFVDDEGDYTRAPVLLWGLTDTGLVVGMLIGKSSALITADSVPGFTCYVERSQFDIDADDWQAYLYRADDDADDGVELQVAAGGRA